MNWQNIGEDLAAGRIELWQIPAWALELWDAGYYARDPEVAALEQQLAQAEADADRYFELWRNPGAALSAMRQRRIDQALAEADDAAQLHTEADVLRVAVEAATPPRRKAA